jgi:6-phosphogluconolactonase
VVDQPGANVLVANYGGGSVGCLPLNEDGALTPLSAFIQHHGSSAHPKRQTQPHAHGIYTDPANRFVLVPDLGLDKVMVYRFDAATGSLEANEPPFAPLAPGSGPRHLTISPTGHFVYVINELTCTLSTFSYDQQRGVLTEIQTVSTLPNEVPLEAGFTAAEVYLHPSGRFLYGSNRGHDSLTVYAVQPKKGTLTFVENVPSRTAVPRGFGIDPTGNYLIVGGQQSDDAAVFRIDSDTGRLQATGQKVRVGAPVCVTFVPR